MDKKILIPIIVIFVLGIGVFAWHYFGIPAEEVVPIEILEAKLEIVSELRIVGNVGIPGRAQDVFISGNHAFVADGREGLQIIEVFE